MNLGLGDFPFVCYITHGKILYLVEYFHFQNDFILNIMNLAVNNPTDMFKLHLFVLIFLSAQACIQTGKVSVCLFIILYYFLSILLPLWTEGGWEASIFFLP